MEVYDYIQKKLSTDGALHFTLIDPDPEKITAEQAGEVAKVAAKAGTDAIMVGGSMGFATPTVDEDILQIKKAGLPVIIFPGNVSGVSKEADALFYMSLLNSNNPYWIVGAQVLGAPIAKRIGIEVIPMAYLVVSPGGTVSFIGDVKPLPRKKPELSAAYALAGQFMGMRLIYLEAGSGVSEPVPVEVIKAVDKAIDVPLVVGGALRTPELIAERVAAGADIVVTGSSAIEEEGDVGARLRNMVKAVKKEGANKSCLSKAKKKKENDRKEEEKPTSK